jgi:hypothetical protein
LPREVGEGNVGARGQKADDANAVVRSLVALRLAQSMNDELRQRHEGLWIRGDETIERAPVELQQVAVAQRDDPCAARLSRENGHLADRLAGANFADRSLSAGDAAHDHLQTAVHDDVGGFSGIALLK